MFQTNVLPRRWQICRGMVHLDKRAGFLALWRKRRDESPEITTSALPQQVGPGGIVAAQSSTPWSIGHRLLSAGRAAFKFARSGFALLPTEQVENRKRICGACEHWTGSFVGKICNICGCRSVKLNLPGEKCPDKPPRWHALPPIPPTIKKWAVGITTAARESPTLERTLDSLGNGGWTDVALFEDIDQPTAAERTACLEWWAREREKGRVTGNPQEIDFRRFAKMAWRNWFGALQELVQTTDADAILLCQDDIVVSRNVRTFLEYNLWPDAVGAVSLYCSHRYTERRPRRTEEDGTVTEWWEPLESAGLQRLPSERELWGAQTLIFPREAAIKLLADPLVHKMGGNRIDQRVRQFCTRSGLGLWMYRPSLAQHIGTAAFGSDSSIGHATSGLDMIASDFAGEETDVTTLLV